MATWCVYHVIYVSTPHRFIPKLTIRNVPGEERVTHDMLERAGYQYGEFGVAWANHVLEPVNLHDSPSDLIFRLRLGEGDWIDWPELQSRIEAPL